jgi:phosphonate transport system ATP-binding protein
MTALLEVNHLSKQFGSDMKALSDVNFSVNEGEFVSIIGPSGAGKSTLLRCINRMIGATSGEITFDNMNVMNLKKKDLKKVRTKIGMIFQHYNLVNRLSVIENTLHGNLGKKSTLAGVLGLYSQEEKEQAVNILHVLGLNEHIYKRADQLSGGQKQRVGIARALIQQPRMLLCDEPIASLDPNSAKIIMDHLRNISTTMGITVLVNLHQVDVALKYSDKIIGINHGQVVYNGSPKEITKEDIQRIYGSEAEDLIFDVGGIHAS